LIRHSGARDNEQDRADRRHLSKLHGMSPTSLKLSPIIRDFRFVSLISNRLVNQTASLGMVLALCVLCDKFA